MRRQAPLPKPSTPASQPQSERHRTVEDFGLQFAGLLEGRYQQLHKALEQRLAHVVVDQVLDQLDGWGRAEALGKPDAPNPPSPPSKQRPP